MGVIDVTISLVNGQLKPSLDPVPLSKQHGDTIKWHNETGQNITVKFTSGTPFPANRNPYSIAAGKQQDSGSIEVEPDTQWNYDITASSGQMADPQVIINR